MGILNNLFGGGKKDQSKPEAASNQNDKIEIFDGFGRKMTISKEEWRKNVIPGNIKRNWNNADELYQDIVIALRDEFFPDILKASERLLTIDKNKERSHVIRGIVLLKNDYNKEAKAILQSYIDKYGETGCVMVNLAKVYAKEGNQSKVEELLWKGLQLDPNQDNGVEWWTAIYNEKGGKTAYIDALKKLADIDGSWRAQLWLAREALEQKDLPTVMEYYKYIISKAKDGPDVLMQISGDLGKNGYYDEIFNLVLPIYDPAKHDVWPGFNILRAYLESGRYEDGSRFLKKMFALKRPDIQERLVDFSTQFEKKLSNLPRTVADSEKISSYILALDEPVFIYGLKGAEWFLPDIERDGSRIALMPLADISAKEKGIVLQQETDTGRLTRSIPLYISERIFFETNNYSKVFITVASDGGLITYGKELGIDYLQTALSKDKDGRTFDYLISGTLGKNADEWEIVLSIWDCKSQTKIKSLFSKTSAEKIGLEVKGLTNELLKFIKEIGSLTMVKPVDYYRLLDDELIGYQLLSYGQALVQIIVANGYGTKDGIFGERSILRNPLDLALLAPNNVLPKILFISALVKAYSYHSDSYQEFKDYAIKLLNENKSNESVMRFSPLIYKIYGMNDDFAEFEKGLAKYSESYRNWFIKIKDLKPAQ